MLRMIDPDRALELVEEAAERLPPATVELERALGRALAERPLADRDYPPFSRAMMDGYAVRLSDAGGAPRVVGEVAAGQLREEPIEPGSCVAIMTGAPCPPGTEAVVKHEDTTRDEELVQLPASLEPAQNIVAAGSERAAGEAVLEEGQLVTPLAVAILASIGRRELRVVPAPTLAIVTTGSELVEPGAAPGPAQIRDSNGPMIAALARASGVGHATTLHAADTREALAEALGQAESSSIVVLAGGVSAGRYDLVPEALEAYGAEAIFHKVTQKPGKPLLFARRGAQLIFGLPGNPLSCHFCFLRYVAAAARRMAGRAGRPWIAARGRLTAPLGAASGRTFYLLATAAATERGWELTPALWRGSADIFSAHQANAYMRLDPGGEPLPEGAEVPFARFGALE